MGSPKIIPYKNPRDGEGGLLASQCLIIKDLDGSNTCIYSNTILFPSLFAKLLLLKKKQKKKKKKKRKQSSGSRVPVDVSGNIGENMM